MRYLFMTAGSLAERDYTWWKYTGQSVERATPSDLPQLKLQLSRFADWLDNDPTNFSLFFGRDSEDRLFLVICNLETKRRDHHRRTIRNSIILIADENKEDGRLIRQLGAAALDDVLRTEIAKVLDLVVEEDTNQTENWLRFDIKKWEDFLKGSVLKNQETQVLAHDSQREFETLICNDTKENREFLRAILLADTDLPAKTVLAIVTGYKSSRFYKNYGPDIYIVLTKIYEEQEKDEKSSG